VGLWRRFKWIADNGSRGAFAWSVFTVTGGDVAAIAVFRAVTDLSGWWLALFGGGLLILVLGLVGSLAAAHGEDPASLAVPSDGSWITEHDQKLWLVGNAFLTNNGVRPLRPVAVYLTKCAGRRGRVDGSIAVWPDQQDIGPGSTASVNLTFAVDPIPGETLQSKLLIVDQFNRRHPGQITFRVPPPPPSLTHPGQPPATP
jgi:hypothetical protein